MTVVFIGEANTNEMKAAMVAEKMVSVDFIVTGRNRLA